MKIFHGWRIVGAGATLHFLHAGLLMQAFGAYVAALSAELGWSKTSLAGGAALQSVEGALLGPILGWLMDRFGGRVLVHVGVLAFGLGLIALSQIETMGGFYAAIMLVAIGTSLSGYFPLSITVVHWFRRQRARALSIMGMGMALGGTFVPVVAWTMQTWGWRTTAFASGVLAIVVGLPLARMLRRRPEDIGEHPDGVPPEPDAGVRASNAFDAGPERVTAAQALRTRAFWLLAVGHGTALLVVTAINVHAISHMKEGLGYTISQASFVITLMTLCQLGGVLAGAAFGDRFEKRKLAAACMLAHMAGLLLLAYAQHPAWLVGFAVLHGTAWGLRGPLMQAIRADYFGLHAIGMIMGLSALITAMGQVIGPLLAGLLADLTGNYRAGFTALALVAGSGSLLFLLARRPRAGIDQPTLTG
ncbi:MFS transporter [Ramlibacter sp. AW1]|uniref:MFS transporter n=1 Tax=Ramlibacter aurantiacus TaxID=2801330 RepID=A0A936ZLN1_9BURK|nr:MFS transporter [Ramlibacter aurantiacus]MBL0419971.1 MFS transporter [Ramlibacter aurantiacus]